ncbi:MAG: protein-L-isoaspartate(D-aspartate) O-methyltransferase [Acidobacteria bacterium]|nr:MAG: protein-L-isoaspartate(D-aspartate) O-methyltransferase [Acidobacteriota bacterium]
MVERDLTARGVEDPQVLEAMRQVPRHLFVPEALRPHAYEDRPLPIGLGQTISQPYIVALMTALADVGPGDRVLEIGTGSGYQAAVLSVLAHRVYSIEILEELSLRAQKVLHETGRDNIEFRVGDGYRGWPEAAPFDAIVVTAAPPHVPQPLVEQLAQGGRLVIPVGTAYQELLVLEKTAGGLVRRRSIPVRFVPMTGEAQQ